VVGNSRRSTGLIRHSRSPQDTERINRTVHLSFYHHSTAIVTGAASGIGLALSEALHQRRARVWLTDINQEAVHSAARRLGHGATSMHWMSEMKKASKCWSNA
jgi:2-polyprenyl-3-methyl-5-hydroxy-6-metoxy-1,4-benzoquinol methylase